MQKVLNFGILAFFLLLTACTTSSNPIDISISETSIEKIGLAVNPSTISITVTNNNHQTAEIHWNRIEVTSIVGWTYELNGNASNTGILSIPPNSSVNVILSILPNGNIGTGSGNIEFYDPAHQQTTTKIFNYKLTAINEYFRLNLAAPANATSHVSSSNPPYSHIHHVWLINDNTIPVQVQWARTKEQSIPTAWILAAKTHETCYTPFTITDGLNIPPMDSVPFKLIFDHYNSAGYGRATPIFWVDTDSLNSVKIQPFTYEVKP